MRRWLWAPVVFAVIAIAAWYVRSSLDTPLRPPKDTLEVEADTETPLPPVERPAKLELKRIPDDPAIEAKLPEPCPLNAIEYRYGSLLTNVLLERFDGDTTSRKVVFGRRRIQVNTDGAPNSYHSRAIKADDETVGAINIICNAKTKIFKKTGETKSPVACRQKDFSVADEFVTAYEELRNNNWDDTESGYSIQFDWSILGRGAKTRPDGPHGPCIKQDGFFVAKTRLRFRSSNDECDGSIYPDSNVTSAFVLPMNWFGNYQKADGAPERFSSFRSGDLVVAYRPGDAVRQPVWAYGVVGDAGPFTKLGEASIAFNRQILRSNGAIKTYRAALALDTDMIRPSEIGFVVFEGSAADLKNHYSADNIKKAGEKRFAAWMNGALDKARSRFLACVKKLELLPPPQPLPPA